MEKRKGRPRTGQNVKPGQLQEGLSYFTFVANSEKVSDLKRLSKSKGISIKDLMDEALDFILEKRGDDPKKQNKEKKQVRGVGQLNEALLKEFLNKKATR